MGIAGWTLDTQGITDLIDAGDSRPGCVDLPLSRSAVDGLGATYLRRAARLVGLAGHFASNGDADTLRSVLSGETSAADWMLDSSGRWVHAPGMPDAPDASTGAPATPDPTPAPAPAPASTPETGGVMDAFSRMIAETANQSVRAEVERIIGEQGGATPPIVVHQTGADPIEIGAGEHPALGEIVKLDAALPPSERNYLMVGPAGTGKTTIARRLAETLGLGFGFASCSAGMSESALLGRVRPFADPGSDHEYASSAFVDRFSWGGIFLADEIDGADANVLLVLNAALANGAVSVPLASRTFERHESFRFIGAANTFGTGPNRQYAGRAALDAATLDRFVGRIVEVDYDRDLERRIVEAHLPDDARAADQWISWIADARRAIDESGMRRIVSTRAVVIGANLLRAGYTLDSVQSRITTGWSADERAKIGGAS